jgi:hypothetical protein
MKDLNDLSGQLVRQKLLAFHMDAIRRMVMEHDEPDPVGFIIDATDRLGGELARVVIADKEQISLEDAEAKLTRMREECRACKQRPTLLFVADWQFAEEVMPYLAPTASERLKRFREKRRPGMELVIVIANGGNFYALVGIERPVSDGQHRTSLVIGTPFRIA